MLSLGPFLSVMLLTHDLVTENSFCALLRIVQDHRNNRSRRISLGPTATGFLHGLGVETDKNPMS